MTIDPMLYERVSGRSGDPTARMGQALAGADAAKAKRQPAKDVPVTASSFMNYGKAKLTLGGIVGLVVIVGVLLIIELFR